MRDSLTPAEARRTALAAQGFTAVPRTRARRPFDPALERMHVLQIDSVNVFARSHYLPIFSRHGSYDERALDRLLWQSGEFTEYWAHEAAHIAVSDRPLFQWRMDEFRERHLREGFTTQHATTLARVSAQLAASGPQLVRDLELEPRGSRGSWWDWSDTKVAVERLFAWGDVVSVGRERFERRYALVGDALPGVADAAPPTRADAQHTLVERAARSLGVATLADLADYHRLKLADARVAVQRLVEEGILLPVQVRNWTKPNGDAIPAWLHHQVRVPSRLSPDALLTPFDPICWFRPRTERLFGFRYRLEIYTPKEKRQFGYYCLPLMVGGRLVGRIDVKADRSERELLVQAAWQEEGAPRETGEVARRLLARAAEWQGLETVAVRSIGNLPLPERFTSAIEG